MVRRPSHGARPVHLIITMMQWIRTSRLSIKNSLSRLVEGGGAVRVFQRQRGKGQRTPKMVRPPPSPPHFFSVAVPIFLQGSGERAGERRRWCIAPPLTHPTLESS